MYPYRYTLQHTPTHAPGSCPIHLLKPLLGSLPVDDVPNRLEVLGLSVLVVEVIRMLPGIDAEKGAELADDGILVGIGPNLHTARLDILHQPRPAAALDAGERGVELVGEGGEAAVAVVDGLGEGATGRLAAALAGGRKVLPEEGVVDVAATVKVDGRLEGELGLDVGLGLGFGELLRKLLNEVT